MASSQAVYIKSGDQPRAFQWGNPAAAPLTLAQATIYGGSNPIYKESVYSTFQASVTSLTLGALTATVAIQCSNDDNTGRGFVLGGDNAPGFAAITTAAGTTVTAVQGGIFTPNLVGALVYSPNVPAGVTVAAVASNGLTLTLSSGAGVLAGTAPMTLFAQNWCATALGTITLTGTITAAIPSFTDGFSTQASWRYVRALASNVTGTGALVSVWMGV